jgi:hypothetical protein
MLYTNHIDMNTTDHLHLEHGLQSVSVYVRNDVTDIIMDVTSPKQASRLIAQRRCY